MVRDLGGHSFFMNLVERYSPAVRALRAWLAERDPVEVVRVEGTGGNTASATSARLSACSPS